MTFFGQSSASLPTVPAMSTQPPSEDPTQQHNPQQGGQPPESGGKNPWPWILGAIAIIVAGVIAAILITGGNDSGSSTDASITTPVTTLTTKTATSTPTTTVVPTTTTATTTTTAPINITRTCTVNNIPGVAGNSTVANVNATDVPASQTALASCTAASALVKGVARTGAEMPVTVQGSQCTPSVSGSTAKWTCVENGADSGLTITTKFPLTYTN